MRRRLLVVLFASTCACASERQTTWADDQREGIPSVRRVETAQSATAHTPKAFDAARADGAVGTAKPPEELEMALLRFASKRRLIDTEQVAGEGWPRPVGATFEAVLDELESGFTVPKGTVPRRVLIQARVTLEAEMERAQSRFGAPPPSVSERMTKVFAMIAIHMRASKPVQPDRPRTSHGIALAWPVTPVIVSSGFGYRRDPILGRETLRFHAGVDLAGEDGDVIRSAAAGRVVSAGWLGGHGRTVIVQHPGGYQTFYAHMRGILVRAGSEVELGSPIGFMGSSGRSTGPHLHFELRQGGAPIDPLEAIDLRVANERGSSPSGGLSLAP